MTAGGYTERFSVDTNITYTNLFVMSVTSVTNFDRMVVDNRKLAVILGFNNLNTGYQFNQAAPLGSNLTGNRCV